VWWNWGKQGGKGPSQKIMGAPSPHKMLAKYNCIAVLNEN